MFALRNLTLVYYFCFCIFMPLYFIADGAFMKTRVANLLFQALVYSFFRWSLSVSLLSPASSARIAEKMPWRRSAKVSFVFLKTEAIIFPSGA